MLLSVYDGLKAAWMIGVLRATGTLLIGKMLSPGRIKREGVKETIGEKKEEGKRRKEEN